MNLEQILEIGILGLAILVFMFFSIFFTPSIIAIRKNHKDKFLILFLNIILGASGIGWIIFLVWAIKGESNFRKNDNKSKGKIQNEKLNKDMLSKSKIKNSSKIGINEIENSFPPNIYNEIQFIFSNDEFNMMKFFPELDEGVEKWKCSCGYNNNDKKCKVCGIEYIDLKEKFNYSYINNHMKLRLEKENKIIEEQNEKKILELEKKNIEKRKKMNEVKENFEKKSEEAISFISKYKNRIKKIYREILTSLSIKIEKLKKFILDKKNRKKVFVCASTILFLILSSSFFIFTSYGKSFVLNQRAGSSYKIENYIESEKLFKKSISIRPNENAFLGLINIYLKTGETDKAKNHLSEARIFFQNSEKIDRLILDLKPKNPLVNLLEGEYKTPQKLNIELEEYLYDAKIMIKDINSNAEYEYSDTISLNESKVYQFEIWTENGLNLKSEKNLIDLY